MLSFNSPNTNTNTNTDTRQTQDKLKHTSSEETTKRVCAISRHQLNIAQSPVCCAFFFSFSLSFGFALRVFTHHKRDKQTNETNGEKQQQQPTAGLVLFRWAGFWIGG